VELFQIGKCVTNCCYCSCSILSLVSFHFFVVQFFVIFYRVRTVFSAVVVLLSCPLYVLTAFFVFSCFLDKDNSSVNSIARTPNRIVIHVHRSSIL